MQEEANIEQTVVPQVQDAPVITPEDIIANLNDPHVRNAIKDIVAEVLHSVGMFQYR